MITYDASRSVWDFTKVDEAEKKAMMELAEAHWANMMAAQIARQMMTEAATSEDFRLEGNEEGFH
jgi:hypothetical protein